MILHSLYVAQSFYYIHAIFRTNIRQTALITIRFCSCCTNGASMIYQPMAEITAFFRRNDLPKFHLYFLWFLDSVHQTHAVYQSNAMGIGHDRRFPIHIPHDEISTLSSYTRQFHQCLYENIA